MKILYLVSKELDETAKKIIDEHKKSHDVSIIEISGNSDYDGIVDAIVSSDKVISW